MRGSVWQAGELGPEQHCEGTDRRGGARNGEAPHQSPGVEAGEYRDLTRDE